MSEDLTYAMKLAAAGRLLETAAAIADPDTSGMYVAIHNAIGYARYVATRSQDPEQVAVSRAILSDVARWNRRWVEQTPAQEPPMVLDTMADLERLFIRTLAAHRYYQPVPSAYGNDYGASRIERRFVEEAWSHIRPMLGDLAGASVLEVGPAEGFHTVSLLKAGATVTSIERNHLMAFRCLVFGRLNGVGDRLQVMPFTLQKSHVVLRGPYDLIFALGIIYHFVPLVENLEILTSYGQPIALEFNAGHPGAAFDPAVYRDGQGVPLDWLTRWLDTKGFDCEVCEAWNEVATDVTKGRLPNQQMLLAKPRVTR